MRRDTQAVSPDGLVLYLEDDSIVPPETYRPLLRHLIDGAVAASGFQVSRHGRLRAAGIWRFTGDVYETLSPGLPFEDVDAVGHYCLLTTGRRYKAAPVEMGPPPLEAVDRAHTYRISRSGRVVVDWRVGVGHLLAPGNVIPPVVIHKIAFRAGRKISKVRVEQEREERQMVRGRFYRTKERVVVDGRVLYGRRREIPYAEALDLARSGHIIDPELLAEAGPAEPKKAAPKKQANRGN